MKLKAFVLLSRVFVLVLLGGAATNADVVTQAWSCPTICDSRVNGYDGAADTNHLIAVVKSIDGHTYTYTTGQTPDGLGGYMIAIWKFDESGHLDGDFPLVWYDTIPSKAYPVAIVVESTLPQAPIYVVGAYAHAGEGLNVVILKIDYLTIGGHAHITPPQTYNNSAQNGDDYPVAMTDVVNGNLWVAVASTGVGTGMDYLVLGVDPAGLSIFASARYNNSPSNKSDIPADIKATSVGFGTPSNTSVVITGTSFDNVTKNDIVTIEYTYLVGSCGLVQRPELRYSGLPGATTNEVATSLAITGSGVNYAGDCGAPMSKIFVCGYTNGTPSGTNDYLVIGYPRTGSVNVPWRTTASHPSGANGNDTANKIVLAGDIDGTFLLYVTGTAWGGVTYNYDEYTIALFPDDGSLHWYNASFRPGDDRGTDLAALEQGNVYVTGKSFNGTDYDYRTTKFDTLDPLTGHTGHMLGNRLWSITYNAPAGGPDAPAAIAVIEAGGIDTTLAEIYVTGRSFSTFIDTSTKYLTMKYTETH